MDEFRAMLIENADVQHFRMEIDAALMFMLLRVTIPPGFLRGYRLRAAAILLLPLAAQEAWTSSTPLHRSAARLRFC